VPQGTALHDRARTAILDAAATIFAEQGEVASLADVALAAGVARPMLYRDGTLLRNLDPEALASIYGDLVIGAITRSTRGGFSAESASVLIVSIVLDGARQKDSAA
jgi:hypothetical protein